MLRRLFLFLLPAASLAELDFLVKARVATTAWDYHPRSFDWSVLALVGLAVLVLVALMPSKLNAVAAGIVAGGVVGNVVSAYQHGGRVLNPPVTSHAAFNLADVWTLAGLPLLMVALARVAIRNRDTIGSLRAAAALGARPAPGARPLSR